MAGSPTTDARWLRLPPRTARLRLTLLYSGVFLALGTAIVVVIYLVGSHGEVVGSSSGRRAARAASGPARGSSSCTTRCPRQHSRPT